MSNTSNDGSALIPSSAPLAELAHCQRQWWCLVALGVLLSICGFIAIAFPLASSVGVTVAFGVVLMISGLALIISAFWTGNWSAFLVHLLAGIIYTVTGFMVSEAPLQSTAVITMLAASMFCVIGVFRIASAISMRYSQWGWGLLNGCVTLLLGVMVFKQFQESALWLIGTLFGVDMIFNGITWSAIGLALKNADVDQDAATGTVAATN